MSDGRRLLDTNVLVAAVAVGHMHHTPSLAVIETFRPGTGRGSAFAAAHSYAEAYNTLTRLGPRGPFKLPPVAAALALHELGATMQLIGLTPGNTIGIVEDFARMGGIGPRLYDSLIGRTAMAAGIDTVITWNVAHFTSLFPRMRVLTPARAVGA